MRNSNFRVAHFSLFVLFLIACPSMVFGQATIHRPIEDFINKQVNQTGWQDPETGNFIFVDYLGRINNTLSLSLDTTVTGSVTEHPLADGRARVLVQLKTDNALTYVAYTGLGVVFGHVPNDVKLGKDAGLASSSLTVDFINTAPGAPLPNLIDLVFAPSSGQFLNKLSFVANATGTMRAAFGVPEGTPGKAHTTQEGLYGVPGKPPSDVFPTEYVRAYPVGN